ncbi:MAG: SUMF1/EgtB/PvdO family nonheme iron enzyme [Rhodospirillaceae bacterium]|nr:SUMF1/EgtB/PvdO family nonheme iron enzyme [Rhodospirillales bacterium]
MPRVNTVGRLKTAVFLAFCVCCSARAAELPAMIEVPSSPPISMSRSEVTFDQWQACVVEGACKGAQDDHAWGRGSRPVINVSWADARNYAAWLSTKTRQRCRLPSEAEWEHAAAGGATTAYWWGEGHGTGMANCRDCNADPIYGSRPVGSFPANPYGLVDMNGNVWEWTDDCWTAGACGQRVIKGGSWYYYSANATVRARARNDAQQGSYNIGIRVVCAR